eukprot:gene4503-14663_t
MSRHLCMPSYANGAFEGRLASVACPPQMCSYTDPQDGPAYLRLFYFVGPRYQSIRAFAVGFIMTFFTFFDVPVFWPILLLYWFVLFFVTMKRQIQHMVKYRYIPFSFGKKKYGASKGPVVKDSK